MIKVSDFNIARDMRQRVMAHDQVILTRKMRFCKLRIPDGVILDDAKKKKKKKLPKAPF